MTKQFSAVQLAIAIIILFTSSDCADTTNSNSNRGSEGVIFSTEEDTNDLVKTDIDKLTGRGYVKASSFAELNANLGSQTKVFVLTRNGLERSGEQRLRELYSKGFLFVGLDVTLPELQFALTGYVDNPSNQLTREMAPGRPIFVMLGARGGCRVRFSDWLDNWNIVSIIEEKSKVLQGSSTPTSC